MSIDFNKVADLLDAFADKLDEEISEKQAACIERRKEELTPLVEKFEYATGEKLAEEEYNTLLNADSEQFISIMNKFAAALPSSDETGVSFGKANTRRGHKKSAKEIMDDANRRFESWCKDPNSISSDSLS